LSTQLCQPDKFEIQGVLATQYRYLRLLISNYCGRKLDECDLRMCFGGRMSGICDHWCSFETV
jgi:hypothetical protein